MVRRLLVPVVAMAVASLAAGAEIPKVEPGEVDMNADLLNAIQGQLQNVLDTGKIPGAHVVVVRDGKQVAEAVVGYPDNQRIFRLFSQSKPVTSTLVMMLVEQGKISLDDPLSKFLPGFENTMVETGRSFFGNPILEVVRTPVKIEHLLTHTGGFVYDDGGSNGIERKYRELKMVDYFGQTMQQFGEKLLQVPLATQPGTVWRYSISMDVLGYVVEKAAGKPFDKVLRELLLDPLDMKDTDFWVPPEKADRLVTHYLVNPYTGTQVEMRNGLGGSDFTREPSFKSGGSGLVSTARDYARFATMLAQGGVFEGRRYLQEATIQNMFSNHLPAALMPFSMYGITFRGVGFGLGLSVQMFGDMPNALEGEVCWGGAANTNWWVHTGEKIVIIALTQKSPFGDQIQNVVKPLVYKSLQGPVAHTDHPGHQVEVVADKEGNLRRYK